MESLSLRTDESIDEVVERYADMVYRLACAQTGRRDSADDVFQEVFLRLVRRNPTFASEEHRKAWLLRVTLNCCKKLGASAWRRHVVPVERLPEHGQADDFEALALRDALAGCGKGSRRTAPVLRRGADRSRDRRDHGGKRGERALQTVARPRTAP